MKEKFDPPIVSTCEELENYPNEYKKRKKDKFNYIYPKGESYKILQSRQRSYC